MSDDGSVAGIEVDFKNMQPLRADQPMVDMWETCLRNAPKSNLGNAASAQVAVSFVERAQGTVAIIKCARGATGSWIRDADFYVRAGNSTQKLTPREAAEYERRHWASLRRPQSRPRQTAGGRNSETQTLLSVV